MTWLLEDWMDSPPRPGADTIAAVDGAAARPNTEFAPDVPAGPATGSLGCLRAMAAAPPHGGFLDRVAAVR